MNESEAATQSPEKHEIKTSCDLCGHEDYRVLYEAGVAQLNRIVKCVNCGFLYANPLAKNVDVEDISNWDPDWDLIQNDRFRFIKERLSVRDYRATRQYINKKYPKRGRFVEIGGSLGFLTNSFKNDGWQVELVEPWLEACQYAESEFGIKAHNSTLEQVQYEDNSLDVVLMIHVIEHVPSPTAIFKEVYRILKPGGMFVVETPRYDSLIFRILGRHERSINCDGHIYFFTTKTLRLLGEKVGLRSEKTIFPGRTLSIDRLFWNIGVMSKSSKIEKNLFKISDKLGLREKSIYLNMRDMQRMYFVK